MEKILNIYIGNETTVNCQTTFYDLLMAGEIVTPNMILAKIMGEHLHAYDTLNLDDDLPDEALKYRIEQKKIMQPMFKLLYSEVGEDIERVHLGKHHYAYIYHGADKDPLREMRLYAVQKNINDFRKFCEDSAGFFPKSWFEHFFRNTQELQDVNKSREEGEACMVVSIDRQHDNIELLPILYEKIKSQQIIEFDYCHSFGDEVTHRIIHPQFLHEYNGRWHLFGFEKDGDKYPANIALDRIVPEKGIADSESQEGYIPAEPGFYKRYLDNLIGVTHGLRPTPENWEDSKPHKVRMRAYSKYIYGLMKSKRFHHSQEPIGEFNDELGYGDFEMFVELNDEFIGQILHYGPALEIIEPKEYRDEFIKRVTEMSQKYRILPKKEKS